MLTWRKPKAIRATAGGCRSQSIRIMARFVREPEGPAAGVTWPPGSSVDVSDQRDCGGKRTQARDLHGRRRQMKWAENGFIPGQGRDSRWKRPLPGYTSSSGEKRSAFLRPGTRLKTTAPIGWGLDSRPDRSCGVKPTTQTRSGGGETSPLLFMAEPGAVLHREVVRYSHLLFDSQWSR